MAYQTSSFVWHSLEVIVRDSLKMVNFIHCKEYLPLIGWVAGRMSHPSPCLVIFPLFFCNPGLKDLTEFIRQMLHWHFNSVMFYQMFHIGGWEEFNSLSSIGWLLSPIQSNPNLPKIWGSTLSQDLAFKISVWYCLQHGQATGSRWLESLSACHLFLAEAVRLSQAFF